jgi:DNA-binding protein H-NS
MPANDPRDPTRMRQLNKKAYAMKKTDLETLSTNDLWALHEQITEILSKRIMSEKRELERRLAALGNPTGLRQDELKISHGETKRRRKYPRVFPKYRNPSLPSQTWSGRGKKPLWLVAELKAGRRMDDFKIKKSAE